MLAKLDPTGDVQLARRLPRGAIEMLKVPPRQRIWSGILCRGDTMATRIYIQEAEGSAEAALALVQPDAAARQAAVGLAPFLPDELRVATGFATAATGLPPNVRVACHYVGTTVNGVERAKQHRELHGGPGRQPQVTDRSRQKEVRAAGLQAERAAPVQPRQHRRRCHRGARATATGGPSR